MKPVLIKTSRGLINLNYVKVIEKVDEKVDSQGSMKYGIRFALMPQTSAIYEYYETKVVRDAVYEALFNSFKYKVL